MGSDSYVTHALFVKVDEERFEDDPAEFIATDIEGSEAASRRRHSQELLRSMCRQFEAETTAICSTHVGAMLDKYATNPSNEWRAKDVAVSFWFYPIVALLSHIVVLLPDSSHVWYRHSGE